VEDFCPETRGRIVAATSLVARGFHVTGVYVVGSYCFNVYAPTDLDIKVAVANGPSYADYQRDRELERRRGDWRRSFHRQFAVPADIMVIHQDFMEPMKRTCDLGFVVPVYDVLKGRLDGKRPYATLPFHFAWSETSQSFVTYLRDKRTRVLDRLF
jgi:hypothetical protein